MRTLLWTDKEVDALIGTTSSCAWQAADLTIKASDVRPGDLFFASPGDNLRQVFADGAVAAVVSKMMPVDPEIESHYPILRVPCAYEALRCLARAGRARTHSAVIAVQGFDQRGAFSRALGAAADYYEGGRHLSSAMAAMPEICDFSVFSLSPSLAPDVAVIDKPAALRADGLFERMPKGGVVIVNGDDAAYIDVMAAAKACGLSNVMVYGSDARFDIAQCARIDADTGVQLDLNIVGQDLSVIVPTQGRGAVRSMAMLKVAMAVVKLSGMKLKDHAWAMAQVFAPEAQFKTASTTKFPVLDQAQRGNVRLLRAGHQLEEAVFRVKNMVDTGRSRKTLILDQGTPMAQEQDFSLPSRLGGLDVVCASKKVSLFKNAKKALESLISGCKLHHIVPEVLTPGDYVVFKSSDDGSGAMCAESLRLHS